MSMKRDVRNVVMGNRHGDRVKHASISTASSGQTEIVAAVAGKRILVLHYKFVVSGNVAVKFQTASTDLTGAMSHGTEGEGSDSGFDLGLFETVAAEALNINLDAAIQVSGHLTYVEYRDDYS